MASVMTSGSVSKDGRLSAAPKSARASTSRPPTRTMRPRRSRDRAWHHPLERVWCISIRSWLLLCSSQLRIRRLRTKRDHEANTRNPPPASFPRSVPGRPSSLAPLLRALSTRAIGRLEYELSKLGLYHRPGQQPVFVGHGDDDLLPHHAVLALGHLVRKAPRVLVAQQDSAVRVGGLLGPRQQRSGGDPGIHAEGSSHSLLPSIPVGMLQRLD